MSEEELLKKANEEIKKRIRNSTTLRLMELSALETSLLDVIEAIKIKKLPDINLGALRLALINVRRTIKKVTAAQTQRTRAKELSRLRAEKADRKAKTMQISAGIELGLALASKKRLTNSRIEGTLKIEDFQSADVINAELQSGDAIAKLPAEFQKLAIDLKLAAIKNPDEPSDFEGYDLLEKLQIKEEQ